MQLTYRISIQARTLTEGIRRIYPCGDPCLGGRIVGNPSIVPAGGAGTELKNLIAKFGLKPGFNCKCGQHIREMNQNGPDWCEQNIETISGWLREEAQRAQLPFTQIGAKILIRRAIYNANKKQNKETDMTVKLVVEIDDEDIYSALERTRPKEGRVMAATAEPTRATPVAAQSKVTLTGQPAK